MGPGGMPEALEVQCWGHEPAASPLPSSLELALLPGSAPSPKCPDTGVTSATSWCSLPLDTLLVLVTLSLLGSEPDSACPLLARAGSVGGAWPPRFTWDQSPAQLRLQMQPLARPAPSLSCLYLPGDMTPQSPESSAGEQPSPSDPDPDFMPGWGPGASLTLCCPPYSCTHGGGASGPDLLPAGAEAWGRGAYSIWNVPDSPPEWVLGLDMVV